ncbi:MAG: tetratricopeptide repeat protein [Spirochaetaceae bacterium]|jgi:TolA-binding protein|nr:tetratricopeptide repeat protein [Spirochaetaceae bacterium]
MKRIVLWLLIIFLTMPLFSQNREQLLELGRRSYQDRLYSQAIGHFREFMDYYPTDPRRDMALYMTAVSWFYLRNYSSVFSALDSLEENFPHSIYIQKAPYWRGLSYYNKREYEQAVDQFQHQLQMEGEDYYYPRSLLYLGLAQEKLDHWDLARAWYKRMIDELDNHNLLVQAQFRLGLVEMKLQDYSQALTRFQALALNYATSPFARDLPYYSALCYSQMGDYEEANRRYRSYLQLNPQGALSDRVSRALADNYRSLGDLDQALEILEQLQQESTSSENRLEASKAIAKLALEMEDWDRAFQMMNQIYQNGSSSERLQAAFTLAELYIQKGEPNNSLVYLEELVENSYGDLLEKSLFLLAQQKRESGRVDEAIELYRRYWQNYPNGERAAQAARWLISLYQQEDRMEEALPLIEQMLELYPQDEDKPAYLFFKADYLLAKNDSAAALENFYDLWQTYPENPYGLHSLYRVGYIYGIRGEHIRASQYFQQLLDLNPPADLARDALYSLCLSLYLGESYDRALVVMDQFLQLYPQDQKNNQLAYYLADIYYDQQYFSTAYKYYGVAAATAGENQVKSLYMQGLCLYEQELWDQGRAILSDTFNRFPEDSWGMEALYMMGVGGRNAKKYDQAKEDLELAAQIFHGELGERSLFMLTQVLLDQQDQSGAEAVLDTMKNRYPQGDFAANLIYRQGDIAYSLEDYRKALTWYQLCIRQYPQHSLSAQSLLRAAQSRMELLDYQNAADALLRYLEQYPQGSSMSLAARSLSELIRRQKDPLGAEDLFSRVKELSNDEELLSMTYIACRRVGGFPGDGTEALQNIYEMDDLAPLIRNEALLLVALDDENSGLFDEALDLYEVLVTTDSGPLGAEAHFAMARVISNTDKDRGAEEYMNLFYLYPHEDRWASEALFRAWEIYSQLDNQQRQAQMVAEKLKEEYPFSSWVEELP